MGEREVRGGPLQCARDHFLHDFVGAAVDSLDACIAVHAADEVLIHKAIATEELKAFVDHRVFWNSETDLPNALRSRT